MTIENTTGGTIDRLKSFMNYLRDSTDILNDNRGWIQLNQDFFKEGSHYLEYEPIISKSSKKWRWDELVDAVKADPNWTRFLQMLMVDEIAKHYKYYHDISREYRKDLYLHLQHAIITRNFYKEIQETFGVTTHLELTDEQKSQLTEFQLKVIELLDSEEENLELVEELVRDKLDQELTDLEAERERIAEDAQKSGDSALTSTDEEILEYSDGDEDISMDGDEDDDEDDDRDDDEDDRDDD